MAIPSLGRSRLGWLILGAALALISMLEEDLLMFPSEAVDQVVFGLILVTCFSLGLFPTHIAAGSTLGVGSLAVMLIFEKSLPGGAQLAAIFALYMAGSHLARPLAHQVRLITLIPFSIIYLYFFFGERNSASDVIIFVAFAAAAYYLGETVFRKDRAEARLAEQNLLLLEQHELKTQQTITEERARIGRELHDILAHTVSLMVIQTSAARKVLRGDVDRAEIALDAVETSGRNALKEMRTIVARMKADSPAEFAPSPNLAALVPLVETTRAAGLPVTLTIDPVAMSATETLQLTTFRIVQEGLTNALKHGGGGTETTVDISVSGRDLMIRIHNTDGERKPEFGGEGGHGLAGMTERVHVFGGTLKTGPVTGGFLVEAHLPFQKTRS